MLEKSSCCPFANPHATGARPNGVYMQIKERLSVYCAYEWN